RRRDVVIPDRMMNELEVPLALTGLEINRNQALAVQVVSRALAAVVVRRGRFNRKIDETELFVHSDLRPHAGVAVDGPRAIQPRVVAELSGTWNRVERPQHLAGAYVIRAHESLGVVVRRDRHAFLHRRSDEHHILDDGWGRVKADLTGLEVDLLP